MDKKNNEYLESRPPTLEDFLRLCRHLNENKVKYIVIGGMAIIQHGFVRATEDIDLLIESGIENEEKIKKALSYLPDNAVNDISPGDINKYSVVRVADEIIIDLMKAACSIDYEAASESIIEVDLEGVKIPFASMELLWKMKQTLREKDLIDKAFLAERLKKNH